MSTELISRKEINYKGAKIYIIFEEKYADVKIEAPQNKKFDNGDEWYRTQAKREDAEKLARKIIDEQKRLGYF